MYLEKLKIFGFKSFAKKTMLELTPGVTGIVGPNGCGKSNIVDALRWVLGEQKAGTLRSERMESVIFNGAKDMKPMGMAEVSLTIKNTKNVLPIEYSEVLITRRLFRSGESQYLLNNNVCRLKDIADLFMDTGMASNAYSVIELSMVESILSGKPDERRRIFEEAAGVTKYKQRRRITYRKLESTENDLVRVEDIIAEVESKVNSLRRQVKRAQRHQRLTEELRETEIRLATYKYNKIYEELEPLRNDLEEKKRSRESSSAQTSFKEAETESLKTELIKIEQNLRKTQQELNEINNSIRKQEEEILVSRERSKSLESNNMRLGQEIEALSDRILEQQEVSKNLNTDLESIQNKINEEEAHFDEEESAFQTVENDLKQHRESGKKSQDELRMLINSISQKQGEIQRL
ncbi:AAA family ATPase, partial [candidate division KSB1 bacterium]|nr:AAA family ATPase [candidate division KSB1 bacterium]